MKTLYLERSTGECRKGDWVEQLDLEGIERIVVGTGPGSFAGIRSAIAFAQGYVIARPSVGLFGLPSPCAIVGTDPKFVGTGPEFCSKGSGIAVVGDARQGKVWLALFTGGVLQKAVYQVEIAELEAEIKRFQAECEGKIAVISPDHRRIGDFLREKLGESYLGEALPTAEGLRAYAEAHPEALVTEPLPIYLNPAVRS